ncbi:hypothetical protein BH10PSE3_BH10PSE3_11630 [soil metagenome]
MVRVQSGVDVQSFLNTREAGAFLRLSHRTLEKFRSVGGGPTYRKLGGRVVYAVSDLQSWADAGMMRSTNDTPGGVVSAPSRGDTFRR